MSVEIQTAVPSPNGTAAAAAAAAATDPHSLDALVLNIRAYLGSRAGINSEDIQVGTLKSLMDNYRPAKGEWRRFGRADPNKAYTRLLVDGINGRSNLLFIVWNPARKSPVHDHANAHCVMKVVDGSLRETVYHAPTHQHEVLQVKTVTDYEQEQVTYISDEIGLHEVANLHPDVSAVSLHLYTPPHAADFGYNIYDPTTGKCFHVPGAKTAGSIEAKM